MGIKEELGKKIRRIRESLGLSREVLCDDESELTVRQLFRIEKGESLPTLSKLEYIADKLRMPMVRLIDDKYLDLSEEYLGLKNKIISSTVYGNEERVKDLEALFDEIYNRFYDNLPEEEQLAIDVLNANFDVYLSEDVKYGESILEDYMGQILLNKRYTLNDLIIIGLFLITCIRMDSKDIEVDKFNHISERVLHSIDYKIYNSTAVLIIALRRIVFIKIKLLDFKNIDQYFEALYLLIKESKLHHIKPIVTMLEAKYLSARHADEEIVRKKYMEAIKGAEYIGDEVLVTNLVEEMKQDFNR